MSPDKHHGDRRHGDQRDEPLDIRSTREDLSIDEEKAGFQSVEGPGARPGERSPARTTNASKQRNGRQNDGRT